MAHKLSLVEVRVTAWVAGSVVAVFLIVSRWIHKVTVMAGFNPCMYRHGWVQPMYVLRLAGG